MVWTIVGYGPKNPGVPPFIPDFILIRDESSTRCVLKAEPKLSAEQAVPGPWEPVEGKSLYFDDMWCAIEESGPVLFLAANEKEWCSKRAQEIAREVSSLRGDPMRTLALSEAAGRLQGLDVPGLVRRLQLSKKPDESLEDALRRIQTDFRPR